MDEPFPGAPAATLPDDVTVQPRRFEFHDLDSVPQYWFAGNPTVTHLENAFSILIPPGERFFIESVRNYEDEVGDAETRDLIRAFTQQEDFHSQAHNELNASFGQFGIDIEREQAYADQVFARLARILPPKIQLGVTAFAEHLTATGAHLMFSPDLPFDEWLDPELNRFWRWHAAEELEHKSVAFDLFERVGGGYLLRVLSAIIAVVLLFVPHARIYARMSRDDPHEVTPEERRQARAIHARLLRPQLSYVLAYFKPGFHPWQFDDEPVLREWYAEQVG